MRLIRAATVLNVLSLTFFSVCAILQIIVINSIWRSSRLHLKRRFYFIGLLACVDLVDCVVKLVEANFSLVFTFLRNDRAALVFHCHYFGPVIMAAVMASPVGQSLIAMDRAFSVIFVNTTSLRGKLDWVVWILVVVCPPLVLVACQVWE